MRTSLSRGCLLAALIALSSPAMAATPSTAVEISIGGIGPGVDATAFKKVKWVIADALYRGTIDYFDVYGYGKEGGFSACVEQGTFAAAGSFDKFVKVLRAIKPNPTTTAYSVSDVVQCTYPTAP